MTKRIDSSVEATATLLVHIEAGAPDDIFTRAETAEFQNHLYGDTVKDKETVLKHWAYNAIFNGVQDASRLDGWGDLDRGMVEFRVVQADVDDLDIMQEVTV